MEQHDRLIDLALERNEDPDTYLRKKTGPRDYSRIKIETGCDCPPIPYRHFDYHAIDASTYDGTCGPVGRGATPTAAALDLVQQIAERDDEDPLDIWLQICSRKD